MVRSYRSQPVESPVLERILEAALRGPSAGFTQGVELFVVTSAAGRHAIAAAAGEAGYIERGFTPWLSQAPVHVVVVVDSDRYRRRYAQPDKVGSMAPDEWPVPYWWLDAGATLMLLLLAATNEGLAAGFLGSHAIADLNEIVGVASGQAIGVVTIGYAEDDLATGSANRDRRSKARTIHREAPAVAEPEVEG